MPSEAPSSSSSSSSSVLPSSSLFLCETEQETLRDEYGVKAADPCPVCALPVGRHARRPTSLSALLDAAPLSTMMAAVSSPSHSSSHLGKNTTLPKWKVDYHQAKPFLDKIEHLCLADGVDRSVWPRLLLKAIPNVHESSWVVNNIVTPNVDWAQARALFTSHFEMHAYEAVLKKEYATCKQLHRETVQVYADRFMELVTQLRYEDDNELVIDHYLAGLTARNNADFLRTLGTMRLMKNDNSFVFSSLKAVIDLTLSLSSASTVSPTASLRPAFPLPPPRPILRLPGRASRVSIILTVRRMTPLTASWALACRSQALQLPLSPLRHPTPPRLRLPTVDSLRLTPGGVSSATPAVATTTRMTRPVPSAQTGSPALQLRNGQLSILPRHRRHHLLFH